MWDFILCVSLSCPAGNFVAENTIQVQSDTTEQYNMNSKALI